MLTKDLIYFKQRYKNNAAYMKCMDCERNYTHHWTHEIYSRVSFAV